MTSKATAAMAAVRKVDPRAGFVLHARCQYASAANGSAIARIGSSNSSKPERAPENSAAFQVPAQRGDITTARSNVNVNVAQTATCTCVTMYTCVGYTD